MKHKDYDLVKLWVTSRNVEGYPSPVWLFGPPGCGKNVIAEQLAEELGVPFYPMYFGPTTTDSRVIGFQSAAQGVYIPGPAYPWFEHGGLTYWDEIDNSEPSALVSVNSLVANKVFRFPNGDLVKRHPNTYCLAGANTLGTGAQKGFRRQAQDAAARSRWVKLPIDYDTNLETFLAGGELTWANYVWKVRNEVDRLAKAQVWITSRDIMNGAAGLRNGASDKEVERALLCELSEEQRNQVVDQIGHFQRTPPAPGVVLKVEQTTDEIIAKKYAEAKFNTIVNTIPKSDLGTIEPWTENHPYRPSKKRQYK